MTRARAHPLRYSDLRRRLRHFDIIELPDRGKGSERIFAPRGKCGPTYPIKCHGEHTPIAIGTIHACLRRFGIDADLFWTD